MKEKNEASERNCVQEEVGDINLSEIFFVLELMCSNKTKNKKERKRV